VLFYCNSWLYRIKPSVTHEPFHPREPTNQRLVSDFSSTSAASVTPTQLRWKPHPLPEAELNFIDGLYTICGAGSPFLRHGYAVHMYIHISIPFPPFLFSSLSSLSDFYIAFLCNFLIILRNVHEKESRFRLNTTLSSR